MCFLYVPVILMDFMVHLRNADAPNGAPKKDRSESGQKVSFGWKRYSEIWGIFLAVNGCPQICGFKLIIVARGSWLLWEARPRGDNQLLK